jgi:hypothetical protein
MGFPRVSIVVALFTSLSAAQQAEPVGVYGLIDQVTFQSGTAQSPCSPPQCQPDRILISGVFTIADPKLGSSVLEEGRGYLPPARGYLYFKLAADSTPAERGTAYGEWAELASMAGKHEVVGFGLRYAAKTYPIRLRKTDDAPSDPDGYISADCRFSHARWDWNPDRILAFNQGLFRRADDYVPVKSLLSFHQ